MELQRFGRGPEGFPYILTALPDGYWTPWHLADQQIRRLQNAVEELNAGQAVGEAEDLRREVAELQAECDELRMKRMVDDWVKRDAYRYRKLVMQQHKHWLGVFRCDPDGAPSDSISHDELAKLLDAMGGPEMDGAAHPAPAKRPTWVEILLLVNEYTSHVADASQHKAASRQDISKSAALATLGRLRTLLGYGGG